MARFYEMPNIIYIGLALFVLLIMGVTIWMYMSKKRKEDNKLKAGAGANYVQGIRG